MKMVFMIHMSVVYFLEVEGENVGLRGKHQISV
jgi:hypothetical protein